MLLILFVGVGRELQDLGVEEEALEAWHRMQQGLFFNYFLFSNYVLLSTG